MSTLRGYHLNTSSYVLAWYDDKENSRFALSGICWERSKIPEAVWLAGPDHTNTGEAAHFDIQREGVRLSLLVAIIHGRRNDLNASRSRAANDKLQINERYESTELVAQRQRSDRRQRKHSPISIYLMLTATSDSRHIRAMENADARIQGFNSEAERLTQKVISAQQSVQKTRQDLNRQTLGDGINTSEAMASPFINQLEQDLQQGESQLRKAQANLDKASSKLLKLKRGSGRVEFNQVWTRSTC